MNLHHPHITTMEADPTKACNQDDVTGFIRLNALTAPRTWISVEGTDDQNCVPNAVKQSVLAAQPVYAFLGVGVDRVGVNYEPHRHALTADDWKATLDFADQQLRGIDHQRRFDQFPPEQTSAATPVKTNTVVSP